MQWERMGSDRVWPLTCGGGGGGGGSSISTASPTDGRRLRTACAHLHQAHLTPAASATRVRQYRRTRTAYTRYTGMCVAAARGRRESVCVVAASGRGALAQCARAVCVPARNEHGVSAALYKLQRPRCSTARGARSARRVLRGAGVCAYGRARVHVCRTSQARGTDWSTHLSAV